MFHRRANLKILIRLLLFISGAIFFDSTIYKAHAQSCDEISLYTGNASCDSFTTSGAPCGSSKFTFGQSIARPLIAFPGGLITCIDMGFEKVTNGIGKETTLNIYENNGPVPTTNSLILLRSETVNIPDGEWFHHRATLTESLHVGTGFLVIEAVFPDGESIKGTMLHAGDAAIDGSKTYTLAPECGINEYEPLELLGFPNSEWTVCVHYAGIQDSCNFPVPDCAADLNDDFNINILDLLSLISEFGSVGDPAIRPKGDIAPLPNGDCVVNVIDLLSIVSALGENCTPRGACCLPTGECLENQSELDCSSIDGSFQGINQSCDIANCTSAPSNDDCEGSIVIGKNVDDPYSFSVEFDTSIATPSTPDPDESLCSDNNLGWVNSNDLWFSWTPPSEGTATINTCDFLSYDTSVVIYKGNCETQITCNGDGPFNSLCQTYYSSITFDVELNETYYLRIGGYESASGAGLLNVSMTAPGACCLSQFVCFDNFQATKCQSIGGFFQGSNTDCTMACDVSPPGGACCIDAQTCKNNISENSCSNQSGVWSIDLTCEDVLCIDPVINDECLNAISVTEGTTPFTNIGATDSTTPYSDNNNGESNCSGTFLGSMSSDIWFLYSPTSSGEVRVSTCAPGSFDTDLVVYFKFSCNNLVQIACNGDGEGNSGCQPYYSSTSFNALAGEEYVIRVGGYADFVNQGDGLLTIEGTDTVGACCIEETCSQQTSENCFNLFGEFFFNTPCTETLCPESICGNLHGNNGPATSGSTTDLGADIARAFSLGDLTSLTRFTIRGAEALWYPGFGFAAGCEEEMTFSVSIVGATGNGYPNPKNVFFESSFQESSIMTSEELSINTFSLSIFEYEFVLPKTIPLDQDAFVILQATSSEGSPGNEESSGGCWFLWANGEDGTVPCYFNSGNGWDWEVDFDEDGIPEISSADGPLQFCAEE